MRPDGGAFQQRRLEGKNHVHTSCSAPVALANGSFEQPVVTGVEILPDSSQTQAPKRVPGWLTTAPEPLTATSNEQVTQVNPAVVKAADATTVTVGQTVTYRITVHNAGPNRATGVTVTDQLPDGLAFLSADGPGSYDPATGRWAVGTLADGTGATLVLRAKATEAGPVVNTATANEKDPDTTDNTDAVTICVEPAPSCCAPCATRK